MLISFLLSFLYNPGLMIYSEQISFIFIDFSVLIFFFSPKALLLNLFTSFLELKNCLLNISLEILYPFSRQFYFI